MPLKWGQSPGSGRSLATRRRPCGYIWWSVRSELRVYGTS